MALPLQVLVVEFDIKPEHVDEFARAIECNARDSLSRERGCRHFDVCRDPLSSTVFYLYEVYEDEAAVQAHLQSRHFLEMSELAAPWVKTKAVRRLLRTPLVADALEA